MAAISSSKAKAHVSKPLTSRTCLQNPQSLKSRCWSHLSHLKLASFLAVNVSFNIRGRPIPTHPNGASTGQHQGFVVQLLALPAPLAPEGMTLGSHCHQIYSNIIKCPPTAKLTHLTLRQSQSALGDHLENPQSTKQQLQKRRIISKSGERSGEQVSLALAD